MSDAPTNKTAEWIHNAVKKNPCILLEDGNIRTCPVRLGFPHLFVPQPAMDEGKKPKYGATLLFPASADLTILREALAKCGAEKWGDKFTDYIGEESFHKPLQDQGKKKQFQGFVPGQFFVTATGERKPIVQDTRGALVVEEDRVQPGFWAFSIINPFAFETRNKAGVVVKRGLSFGLNAVRLIAEDVTFGGSSIDPEKAFAGIDIEADVNPSGMFSGETGGAKAKSAADLL